MTRVFFVRHGETDWNVQKLVQGSIDIPLNEVGRRQAQALAEHLSQEKIHHIYTSQQKRARETAEAISQYHPNAPFTLRRDLTEYHMGKIEGKQLSHVREIYQEDNWDSEAFRTFIGGESFDFYVKHFQRYLPLLFRQHAGQNIVLSTHGGKMKSLLYSLFPDPETKEFIRAHHPTNCSVTIVEWHDPQKVVLVQYSNDQHLPKSDQQHRRHQ